MDQEDDFSFFVPKMLKVPELELSPLALKLRPEHIDITMDNWRSLPETSKTRMMKSIFDNDQAGTSINVPGNYSRGNAVAPFFFNRRMPPLAPIILPRDPSIKKNNPALPVMLKVAHDPVQQVIPQFYFPNGCPPPNELKEECISRVNHLFNDFDGGLMVHEFEPVTKEICRLPSFLFSVLFENIDIDNTGVVTRDAFINYWVDGNMPAMDTATQVYKILKQPDNAYLSQDDFKPILQEFVDNHPALEFLRTEYEFRDRYVETVIYRIFYYLNRSQNGRLTLRELKHGDLIAAMQQVDIEEDINKVRRYFSYKHFYVIWGKFVELDTDEDFLISEEDLVRYADYALSCWIRERIFSQVARKFTSNVEGKMCYEDFVYFLLSEEDKSSEPSIEYWFKCLDLQADGVLTAGELKLFYQEQRHRLRCKCEKYLSVKNMLRRIFDMIAPKREGYITLGDLKKSKLSGDVFNSLFNLPKYRNRIIYRQKKKGPYLSDWDVFAEGEYIKMVRRS